MTHATEKLIDELSRIIDKNKYLLLSGTTASGKTHLALSIANNCRMAKYCFQGGNDANEADYEIETEIIPVHPSYGYEDFVSGLSANVADSYIEFKRQDKIFLQLLRKANISWANNEWKKYFIILDDIERGDVSAILGNAINLIEPHGASKVTIKSNDGDELWLSPNVYIIMTKSTVVDSVSQFSYGFLRHFYYRNIDSDYHYMSDDVTEAFSDFDIQPNAMFYRSKRVVTENLRHRYQMSAADRERYILGHGIFKRDFISLTMRYIVLPLLKQYVKDGILDRSASMPIEILEKAVTGQYSKDIEFADTTSITGQVANVNAETFYSESATHKPIVNLVSRIKNQQLLSDDEIANVILFNPGIIVRKKNRVDRNDVTYPTPGYLYVKRSERNTYIYGTTKRPDGSPKSPRYFYSANQQEGLTIKGVDYSVAQEMQPKEYIRWREAFLDGDFENVQYSGSPNLILFRIIRGYYYLLDQKYSGYLEEFPNDDNVRLQKTFAKEEFREFTRLVSQNGSGSDEPDVNFERNRVFREEVKGLKLLWTDSGKTISWMGQTIKVEGVYKVNTVAKFQEFSKAMQNLDIHQMIMQGPPGTSKTYLAQMFLRYIGKGADNEDFLSDSELQQLQIKAYEIGTPISNWEESHPGEKPSIAWDIVQFHPSYGYEDFVRGIEVSTHKDQETQRSTISYETVNKVLGKMAEVAGREENKNTNFFLVIDEINRANLATVFGELIYGLEYRNQSVATPYSVNNSNKVMLPKNLYIIGTMNTADKSIGGIDYAIRRRFIFFSLLPSRDVIVDYGVSEIGDAGEREAQKAINVKAARLFDQITKLFEHGNLNPEYYKDDVQIGHTYFLVSSEDQLFLRFRYQIIPILREYYKDGMFQFEITDANDDGWNGLLNYIAGNSDADNVDETLKDIFDKLIAEE